MELILSGQPVLSGSPAFPVSDRLIQDRLFNPGRSITGPKQKNSTCCHSSRMTTKTEKRAASKALSKEREWQSSIFVSIKALSG